MKNDLFEFESYKDYINHWLDDPHRGGGYGSRAKMAEAVSCQKSYLAQVLNGSAHFSLEQIEAANEYMGHSEQEGFYLLNLVLLERAGSKKLRERFKKQLEDLQASRMLLKNRLGVNPTSLSPQHHGTYYSYWYYAAIHVMISQDRFQTAKSISEHLQLDTQTVNSVIQFLLECRLIEKVHGKYRLGNTRIHLPSDSPLISKHHINWRLQAMRALERNKKENINYSSINTLSKKDALKIREILTHALSDAQKVIKDSPEEEIHCLSLDFFEI